MADTSNKSEEIKRLKENYETQMTALNAENMDLTAENREQKLQMANLKAKLLGTEMGKSSISVKEDQHQSHANSMSVQEAEDARDAMEMRNLKYWFEKDDSDEEGEGMVFYENFLLGIFSKIILPKII